jgi:hypothetical protein
MRKPLRTVRLVGGGAFLLGKKGECLRLILDELRIDARLLTQAVCIRYLFTIMQ